MSIPNPLQAKRDQPTFAGAELQVAIAPHESQRLQLLRRRRCVVARTRKGVRAMAEQEAAAAIIELDARHEQIVPGTRSLRDAQELLRI